MAASLIEHGAIRTTEVKAKELRRFVERLITLAKKGTLHARRQVIRLLTDRKIGERESWLHDDRPSVVQKLFAEVAPRYANRPGGYTRIIRLSDRRIGDAGVQVILQLVEEAPAEAAETSTPRRSRRGRRAARRHEVVAAAGVGREAQPESQGPEGVSEAPEAETGDARRAEGPQDRQADESGGPDESPGE